MAAMASLRVDAGHAHTLAILEDGKVWSWGSNEDGQLGNGSLGEQSEPVVVPSLERCVTVEAGDFHSLAVLEDGSLWAWGNNGRGQLGDGSETDRAEPVLIRYISGCRVRCVAAGSFHTLVLLEDGTLWSSGRNSEGQLGHGAEEDSPEQLLVSGISKARAVSAGSFHSIAIIDDDASIWAWGLNHDGQLGPKLGTKCAKPERVCALATHRAVSVTSGCRHNLAVLEEGSLWAWGLNEDGQVGIGTRCKRAEPSPVGCLSMGKIRSCAAGHGHSLAVLENGELWTWGRNTEGQLGDDTRCGRAQPGVVCSGGMRYVAAGLNHSIVVTESGGLWTWGCSRAGQRVGPEPVACLGFGALVSPRHRAARPQLNEEAPTQPLEASGDCMHFTHDRLPSTRRRRARRWASSGSSGTASGHGSDDEEFPPASSAVAVNWFS